ncbi:MAG: hypothetical protein JRJ08_02825, partial [Deltaproteobacteria bacterium]|nr:hypothetical protein [Deltaproteobacteria bacterium]
KDRTTVFPKSIQREMRYYIDKVKHLHDEDLAQGYGEVYLPDAHYQEETYRRRAGNGKYYSELNYSEPQTICYEGLTRGKNYGRRIIENNLSKRFSI